MKTYLEPSSLNINEKNMILALSKLLDVFFCFTKKDNFQKEIDGNCLEKTFESKKKELYDEMDKFLQINYQAKEFSILDEITFNQSSEFLSILLQNLLFYFSDYEEEEKYTNIYYYLFHLIYYILTIFVNGKGANIFKEDSIKFYVYHIVHFFMREKKNPEYNFFFYEGAFKYLSKKFNITIEYVFKLNNGSILSKLKYFNDINDIISEYRSDLLNKSNQTQNEMNFIGEFSKITKYIMQNIETVNNNNEMNSLLNICNIIKDVVKEIKKRLDDYKLTCRELDDYQKTIDSFINNIETYHLTEFHFDLMPLNYNYNKIKRSELDIYLEMSEMWIKYNKTLEQDYTDLFLIIMNSDDFQKLYLTVMNSSYVKSFVKEKNLTKEYNMFIEKYANELRKYMLYMPLTRGIKAYVSNYFKIVLNINSIDLIDIADEETKKEILKTYLLIMLIHESFHFIFRLNRKGEVVSKVLSPYRKKLKESYEEIGVDIILHIFGTEYITFISLENSILLNNCQSWENDDTDFKVFKKIYFSCGELIGNEKNDQGSGLRCNISMNENNGLENWMRCTDCAIRFCF